MAREDFEGQEGRGGLDDFRFTITGAWFAQSPEYAEKAQGSNPFFLHLIGTTDNEAQPVLEKDGFHPSYSMSEQWESIDNGATITHPQQGRGKTPKLGKAYGRFTTALWNATQTTTPDPLADPFSPHVAASYVGCVLQMEEVTNDWGGTIGKRSEYQPSGWHGKTGSVAPPVVAAPVVAAPVATAPTLVAPSDPAASIPPPATPPATPPVAADGLRPTIVAIATSAATYQEFQSAALAVPGVLQDTELVKAIADQGAGIWTEAGKS